MLVLVEVVVRVRLVVVSVVEGCVVLHLPHLHAPMIARLCGVTSGTPTCTRGCWAMRCYKWHVYVTNWCVYTCQHLQDCMVLYLAHRHVPLVTGLCAFTIGMPTCASSCSAVWC